MLKEDMREKGLIYVHGPYLFIVVMPTSGSSARLRSAAGSASRGKSELANAPRTPTPFSDLEPVPEATRMGLCQRTFISICLIGFFVFMAMVFRPLRIQPSYVKLAEQPLPIGPLAVNTRLAASERLWLKTLHGPESFAFKNGMFCEPQCNAGCLMQPL